MKWVSKNSIVEPTIESVIFLCKFIDAVLQNQTNAKNLMTLRMLLTTVKIPTTVKV